MKQFFNKSVILLLFFTSVFFILISGLSLLINLPIHSEDASLIRFVIIGVIFLLLINLVDVLSFWLIGKRNEFFVKRLAGAPYGRQLVEAGRSFLAMIMLSFCSGLIVSSILAFVTDIIKISFIAIVYALAMGVLIAFAIGWLMLNRQLRKLYNGTRV